MKKRTIYYDNDFEYTFEPIESSIKTKKTKKGFEVRYLTYDENPLNPFENDEGLGNFYHWKDYGEEQYNRYCELLGYNPDTKETIGPDNPLAVRIDKYEHSGVSYSVEGEGTRCRWDTSNTWAVWYPSDYIIKELKKIKNKKKQRKQAVEYARQACKTFNEWANGETYLIVKEIYNKDKKQVDYDCVGGYFGIDYAMESLKTDI